ncbi:c-type cytochrome [Consotaella salsifontis]|uniref:Cytochrome c, mono-and diheme variants n=1 Tax=Consotaella salsifontis TaxID=1365950 RepID=A0A1T4RN63_9HYPH|nr:cytochrome c [Consotaella salsifontis]SKA17236.1 Cytochrome c, mono-and diheme variants [Consotaella salsifontis]
MSRRCLIVLAGVLATSASTAQVPSPLDPATVEAGRAIYGENCVACHGERGQGAENWRQPDENGNLPPPPHDASGHAWRHPDAVLYHMVLDGWRDPFNKMEDLTMPPFEGVLEPREIRAVLIYVKTLWTPEQRAAQAEESRDRPFPDEAHTPVGHGRP